MKVNSRTLLNAINAVSSAVSSNAALPILEGIKFESIQGGCLLTATDLEITLTAFCECTEGIDLVIPSKRLMSTLKALPEQDITLTVGDNHQVTIKASKGRYKLSGESLNDYPNTPSVEGETTDLVFHDFHNAISTATVFTSNDELRPAMTGVYFDGGKVVATDAHKLCLLETEFNGSFILPKKAVTVLKSWNSVNVSVTDNEHMVKVSDGNTSLIAKKIDARYPAYNQVIPDVNDYAFSVNVNTKELLSSLKLISIFANKTTNQAVFSFNNESLTLRSTDADLGNSGEQVISFEGSADLEIGFNARYFIDTLQAIQDSQVTIHLNSPTNPAILTVSDELYLLMPVMLS